MCTDRHDHDNSGLLAVADAIEKHMVLTKLTLTHNDADGMIREYYSHLQTKTHEGAEGSHVADYQHKYEVDYGRKEEPFVPESTDEATFVQVAVRE